MGNWTLAVLGAIVASLAVALGVYAVERLRRFVLFALIVMAIGLDLTVACAGVGIPGPGNVLVVLAAVPLGVWISSLLRDRQALLAVLVTAAVIDVAAGFGDSLVLQAARSSPTDPVRLLVVCVPWHEELVAPVSLVDLVVLSLVFATVRRFGAPRLTVWLLSVAGLVVALGLERTLGAHVSRVPFLAVCGLIGSSLPVVEDE
ncbi:MAG: hypothetical protein AB1486_15825 [Planctomycetota bacterium]